ncbi:hypothetical protein JCM9140_1203 [Halalkalibacter wakoensis JCM 9140]|uniref:DUF4179 domain-containing protein n=1 Tax=Halalkalibacter wakoensis JCM 9140 TaxID=1236970 RepID=W4Q0H1_9BACI|nr:DUF4179 domain-containing protein [Halalkalibacter wakoensis]GAE25223.1 hypothetical protein JCM9140_1203 [Halalkalibacter wakoensis JCM 9140]
MEKWEQKLKNDVNGSLPNHIDQRIAETLQQLPRKKRRATIYYSVAAVVAALSITFGLSVLSPAFAETMKRIPIIGSAFDFVGDISVKKGTEIGLTTTHEEQVEVDGHIITFTDSFYDGARIHLGYIIEPAHNSDLGEFNYLDVEFTINGRTIGSHGMGQTEKELENGLYAGAISLQIRDDLPDSFTLGVRPFGGGSWSVNLPIELVGNSHEYPVHIMKETSDFTMHYETISFLPTSTELALQYDMTEEKYETYAEQIIQYQVIDDKGRVLQPISGGGGGGGAVNGIITSHYKHYFEPLDNIPLYVTIKPFSIAMNTNSPEKVRKQWDGTEIVLSQGDLGQLTILDAKQENGVITFTVEAVGQNAHEQASTFWLEDTEGKMLERVEFASRLEGSVNQYQSSFKAPSTQTDIYVTTLKMNSLNYFEELEVTIELK